MPVDEYVRSIIEHHRQLRDDLLIAVYLETDGVPAKRGRASLNVVAETNGWTTEEVGQAAEYLRQVGLLEAVSMGDLMGLTVQGVQHVERSLAPSDEDPLEPITSVEVRAVERFVTDLDAAVESGKVTGEPDDVEELRGLVKALVSQLHGRGRRRIVRAILHVVGGLLLGMGGNFATELAHKIPALVA